MKRAKFGLHVFLTFATVYIVAGWLAIATRVFGKATLIAFIRRFPLEQACWQVAVAYVAVVALLAVPALAVVSFSRRKPMEQGETTRR